jgi:hypothetical protein
LRKKSPGDRVTMTAGGRDAKRSYSYPIGAELNSAADRVELILPAR